MRSHTPTVDDCLATLPDERREALEAVRSVTVADLPDGFEEAMNWGMITSQVPVSVELDTYDRKPFMDAALASQRQHMAMYLMGVHWDDALGGEFRAAYLETGKKLDMGRSCVRFKQIDDLPLDLIGATTLEAFVNEAVRQGKV
jgi:hypothetical protein